MQSSAAPRPLTTRFGGPLAKAWRSRLFLVLFLCAVASFPLQELRVIPDYLWTGIFQFGYALLLLHQLIMWVIESSTDQRLAAAEGLLCPRCGRPLADEGGAARCGRCCDVYPATYVRGLWGWKSPGETVTLSTGELARDANRFLVPGVLFAVIAVAMLPLLGVWGSSAVCLVALPAGIAAVLLGVRFEARRTLAKRTRRECLKCGYSLAGHDEWRCPECGQRVDWTEEPKAEPPREPSSPGEITMLVSFLLAVVAGGACAYFAASTFAGYVLTAYGAEWLGTPSQVMIPGAIQRMLESGVSARNLTESTLFRPLVVERLAAAERGPAWIIALAVLTLVAYAVYVRSGDRARRHRERRGRAAESEPSKHVTEASRVP